MNRIDQRFQDLAQRGETAFIPYIVAGDPDLATTREIVMAIEAAGADIIEFGVPFSDPVADGIPNQEGALRALQNNVCLADVIRLVSDIRTESQIPILLFTYYNPVLAYGIETFAADAAEAGVDGVLCVDLPPEEAHEYAQTLHANGLATVFLIAPTTPPERMKMIAAQSTGFIYYVSRTGVTGERESLEDTLGAAVRTLKGMTDIPVAVGFGISNPDQAAEVAGYADGVVVGSAIVRLIGQYGRDSGLSARVQDFVGQLVKATKQGGVKSGT